MGRNRFGFHVPPFNSVHHLHLHVLVGPLKITRAWKYQPGMWYWATLNEVIDKISNVNLAQPSQNMAIHNSEPASAVSRGHAGVPTA